MRSIFIFFVFYSLISCGQVEETKEYVFANTIEIQTIDPQNTNYKDLEVIKNAIGDAQIVMLGEQDHGDAPTFLAKTRIIKYLHQELGFDVLAFESDFFALNKTWTLNDSLNPELVFENIYPIWTKCVQTQGLFNYLASEVSSSHPLILTGFDSRHRGPYTMENYVIDFELQLKNNEIPFYLTSFDKFKAILKDLIQTEYKSETALFNQNYFYNCLDTIKNQLSSIDFKNKSFWMQELENLKSNAYSAWNFRDRSNSSRINIRDQQMGKNLIWLAKDKYQGKKIIVWAANSHIAKDLKLIKEVAKNDMFRNASVGNEVFNELGNKMYSIGFSSSKGTAGRINLKTYKIDSPKFNSFEKWVQEKGFPYAFIDFKDHKFKNQYFKMKSPNHSNQSGQWTEIYDGIFYIETMYHCDEL